VADLALTVALFGPFLLGLSLIPEGERWTRRELIPAGALWLVIAVPSVAQLTVWPGLETALERNRHAIVDHGELWRLVTALVVQDGGWGGAIFNLWTLALLAPVAIRLCGVPLALVSFGVGALAGELAGLAWQHVGAGNSIGCCGLAASILVVAAVRGPWPRRAAAMIVAVIGLGLLAASDIHGAAFAVALLVMGGIEGPNWLVDRHCGHVMGSARRPGR
jgi:hypothetical protein